MRHSARRGASPLARALAGAVLCLAALLAAASPALAHPHVFVLAKSEVMFDGKGRIVGIRHAWRFDEAYSAFASQGLDTNRDGKLSIEELQPLAKLNVDSLKDYGYFTFLDVGKDDIDFGKPRNYWLQDDGGLLTLYFELPTAKPVDVKGKTAELDVYDPTYFVAFDFVPDKDKPVALDGAPAGCSVKVIRPSGLDPVTAAQLAQIPAVHQRLPPALAMITENLTNGADITCK